MVEKKFRDLRWGEISVCFRQKDHGLGNDFSSVINRELMGKILRNLRRERNLLKRKHEALRTKLERPKREMDLSALKDRAIKKKEREREILVFVESEWVTEEVETGEPREQNSMTAPQRACRDQGNV